jgi:hypothetical protein
LNDSIKSCEISEIESKRELLDQITAGKEQHYSKIMGTRDEIYSLMESFNYMITLLNEKMLYYDTRISEAEEKKGK